jgi:AcrR family transcriptional regulator
MTAGTPPVGRRERKKAATRKAISDAATRLFLERGFDDVTVKEIADAADVSPTTVFTHFPTKESLVFDEDPEQQAALVAAVRDRPDGVGILDALEQHLAGGRRMRRRHTPEFRAFLALVTSAPSLRDYERGMLLRRESALAEAITSTTDEGLTATQAQGLARFALQAADVAQDQPDPRRALTELFDILRAGYPD